MSALTQYLNVYRDSAPRFDANSAPALNALRPAALSALESAGRLPDRTDEGFEKTSVEEMFAPDFGLNPDRVAIAADIAATFRCDLPQGVTVCSLRRAALEMPSLVEEFYGRLAPVGLPGVALNSLLLQDGVFIHVPAGVRLERPVQLVNIFSAEFPFMAPRRILLVAGRGSEVSVLKCDHSQRSDTHYLSSEVVEIFAGEDARVGWYDLEESSPATARYCQVFARQEARSALNACVATLSNGNTRNEFSVEVAGDGCETHLNGLAIGADGEHVDNNTRVRHSSCRSNSSQLFKYVLDGESTGAFEGEIEVCHGARFNEAYQSNRNILASISARMHSKPRLLIYNDDVKCSHGATTGQLDAKALFYMQARGIPLAEARRMLMQAFLMEPLRDRLRHMVERRFAGEAASCRSCAAARDCHAE